MLFRIITSLLETDLYKFSMGQAIYHQYPSYTTTWTFKCRNKDDSFAYTANFASLRKSLNILEISNGSRIHM